MGGAVGEEFWICDWRFWIGGTGMGLSGSSGFWPKNRFCSVLLGLIFTVLAHGYRFRTKKGDKVNLELHTRSQGWSRSVKPSQTYFMLKNLDGARLGLLASGSVFPGFSDTKCLTKCVSPERMGLLLSLTEKITNYG